MPDVANALVLILVGICIAAAFAAIAYIFGRKATSDELDERGFYGGRKRRP